MSDARSDAWTTIQPVRGWSALGLGDVWEYRGLLTALTWREVKGRYRQMAFGPLWIVLIPLLNMVVFTIVFGKWAKIPTDGLPAPLFYYSALLPWQLFATAATKSSMCLVNNLNVISKIYFPRLIVPLSTVVVGVVDFLMSFVVLVGMMLWYRDRITVTPAVLMLPLYVLLAAATALAVGLWVAAFAVKFRDVGYGIDYLIRVAMFASPVVYPTSEVPPAWQTLYRLNPMTTVIEGFRWTLLGRGHAPDAVALASVALVAVLLVTGAYHFRRTERTIVDLL